MGIDVVRLSPQQAHFDEIVAAFDAARRGLSVPEANPAWSDCGLVDGYWFGDAGIVQHRTQALAQLGT